MSLVTKDSFYSSKVGICIDLHMVLSGLHYPQTQPTPLCTEWLPFFAPSLVQNDCVEWTHQGAKLAQMTNCLDRVYWWTQPYWLTGWLLKPGGQKTPLDPPDSGRACSPGSWGHTLYLVTLQNRAVFCGPHNSLHKHAIATRDNHHHGAWLELGKYFCHVGEPGSE